MARDLKISVKKKGRSQRVKVTWKIFLKFLYFFRFSEKRYEPSRPIFPHPVTLYLSQKSWSHGTSHSKKKKFSLKIFLDRIFLLTIRTPKISKKKPKKKNGKNIQRGEGVRKIHCEIGCLHWRESVANAETQRGREKKGKNRRLIEYVGYPKMAFVKRWAKVQGRSKSAPGHREGASWELEAPGLRQALKTQFWSILYNYKFFYSLQMRQPTRTTSWFRAKAPEKRQQENLRHHAFA